MLKAHFARFILAICASLSLAACGGTQPPVASSIAANAQIARRALGSGSIYVANESGYGPGGNGGILVFPEAANGNVAPENVISGSQTRLTQINGIAVDAAGEIYVVDTDTNQVVGFAPGSTGNVSPNIVIAGSNTGLAWPIGLTVDSVGDLYVANCGAGCKSGLPSSGVLEFAAGSNGNVAPTRNISGSNTQLTRSNGIAWRGKEVYVSQSSSVVVFDEAANGNAAPKRVLSGSRTKLNDAWGVALDNNWLLAGSCVNDDIARFGYRANGDVAPTTVIVGKRAELWSCVDGLTIAPSGKLYGVTVNANPAIVGFYRWAHGNAQPRTYIAGPNTQLSYPTYAFATTAH